MKQLILIDCTQDRDLTLHHTCHYGPIKDCDYDNITAKVEYESYCRFVSSQPLAKSSLNSPNNPENSDHFIFAILMCRGLFQSDVTISLKVFI